jgi:hypothetical protein
LKASPCGRPLMVENLEHGRQLAADLSPPPEVQIVVAA